MFSYSLVQLVRKHTNKLDQPLREKILHLYQPFKWTPCFLHDLFEHTIKKVKDLSVIIEFEQEHYQEGYHNVSKLLKPYFRSRVKKDFAVVNCCSASLTPLALEAVLEQPHYVKKVYLNREVQALLDVAVPSAKAQKVVRSGRRLTGKDVTIAVVDTGIYPHKDLDGRITGFVDFINQKTTPYDDNGHGTHCAGDAVGNGAASAGEYAGPAPEANVIGVKVLDKMGSGTLESIMKGIEWCIQYNEDQPDQKIDIISLSLGSAAQTYENENDDPMVKIVEKAWEAGIVMCVAAGNSGPEPNTIASPGLSDQVITVGALDDNNTPDTRADDEVASFSSRGPTVYGKVKPDILAPGVDIVSLRSPNSFLDKLQKSNRVSNDYFVLSGTSMATPICAGITALILQQKPSATPDEVKVLIKNSADLWTEKDPNIYGAGYINAEQAVPSDGSLN